MKTNAFFHKQGLIALMLLLITVIGCQTADSPADFSAEDSDDVSTEALDDSANDDAEDLALTALSSESLSGGKIAETDDRFECAVVTRTGDKTAGTIRIDFGNGCTDKRGRVRRGAILIAYEGVWLNTGATWSVTFENYFVNDVNLSGIRNVKNITTDTTRRRFQVDMEDGEATWPDGRVARRRLHHIREHERNASNILIRLIIYGTAEGNHRNGRGYYIEILEPLVYERACAAEGVFIPVKGKKLIKHGNRQITVDYGDGTCDNVVTLINANGRTKEIRIPG
jgi:hypothetical protein